MTGSQSNVDVQVLVSLVQIELQGNSCPDTHELKTNTGPPLQGLILYLGSEISLQVSDCRTGDLRYLC